MAKIPIIFFSLKDWQKDPKGVVNLMQENIKRFEVARKEVLKEKTEKKEAKNSSKETYQTPSETL